MRAKPKNPPMDPNPVRAAFERPSDETGRRRLKLRAERATDGAGTRLHKMRREHARP